MISFVKSVNHSNIQVLFRQKKSQNYIRYCEFQSQANPEICEKNKHLNKKFLTSLYVFWARKKIIQLIDSFLEMVMYFLAGVSGF